MAGQVGGGGVGVVGAGHHGRRQNDRRGASWYTPSPPASTPRGTRLGSTFGGNERPIKRSNKHHVALVPQVPCVGGRGLMDARGCTT